MENLESLSLRFRLFHGRLDPLQQMDEWGLDGPVFPASFVHTTYGNHIRLGGPQHGESHLELYVNQDGLVFYDGVWYGDWTVYTPEAEPDLPLSVCDQSKAEIPKQQHEQQTESVDLWSFVEGAIGFTSDVAHGGTHLILTLDNRAVCAVVPMPDFQKLQQTKERR